MNHLKIKKEEFDTTRAEIAKAESLWDRIFPKDYVEFLLQYNGAIVYPNWPNLGPENKTEIWGIERFLSIGDIILQKHNQILSSRIEIEDRYLEEYNLNSQNILVIAQGERGVYFLSLAEEEYGQIYIANFAGGDGISRTSCKSFSNFLNSLGMPEWDDEAVFDTNFEFSNEYNSSMKVMQYQMFYTPEEPEIGFQRFKEVFEYTGNIMPKEAGYPSIIQKYVDERLKLDYLIKQGCNTDGLLTITKRAKTITYLVNELNLDINKKYKHMYPLQNYLSKGYNAQFAYEELHKLLETNIEIDWTIQGKLYNGDDDLPMLEKLQILHDDYMKLKDEENEFQKKYKRPSGRPPFIESKLIESKLGISQNDKWVDKLLNKITRGNKRS